MLVKLDLWPPGLRAPGQQTYRSCQAKGQCAHLWHLTYFLLRILTVKQRM